MIDDDLELFEANGAPPLPSTAEHGYTDHGGAMHSAYLAKSIRNATHSILSNVSHFAPLQRPDEFNAELLGFLGTITRT